jgi:hypothetical protein
MIAAISAYAGINIKGKILLSQAKYFAASKSKIPVPTSNCSPKREKRNIGDQFPFRKSPTKGTKMKSARKMVSVQVR